MRRRILELLGLGEKSSGEVAEAIGAEFGISQAAMSQHLEVLRESGFARVRAEAQRRLYSVDVGGPQAVDAWIGQFRTFWEPKLDALSTEIARGKRERRGRPGGDAGRQEGLVCRGRAVVRHSFVTADRGPGDDSPNGLALPVD